MELALRQRVKGGWWNGLGDEACPFIDDTGMCTEFDPNAYVQTPVSTDPLSDPETAAAYAAALQYGAAHPGDIGVPSGPPPSSVAILQDIAKFAQIGIVALAPSTVTGACPAGYVRSGAACIPAPAAHPTTASLVPGLNNNTLLMIGGGFLLLMLVSGGKRR